MFNSICGKRISCFFLLICFSLTFFCCYASSADLTRRKTIVRIIVDSATLRSTPSLDSKDSELTSRRKIFEVVGEKTVQNGKKWYQVIDSAGRIWWLMDKVVEVIEIEATEQSNDDSKKGVVIEKVEIKADKAEFKDKSFEKSAVFEKKALRDDLDADVIKRKKGVRVIVDIATLRSSPSFDSKNNEWTSMGKLFQVVDEKTWPNGNKWYQVMDSFGRISWIIDKVVEVFEIEEDEQPKVGHERLKREKADKDKAEHERLEKEKADKEKTERERLEKEKADKEKAEHERLEREKADKEKAEHERLKREKADKEKAERERLEKEKADKEKAEHERLEKEKADKEKAERERLEREKADKEKVERERLEKEKADKKKTERKRRTKEKTDKKKSDKERSVKEEENSDSKKNQPLTEETKIEKTEIKDKSLDELVGIGTKLYSEGKCNEVIDIYEKAISMAAMIKNQELEGRLHYTVAECFARLKKYENSLTHLGNAVSFGKATNSLQLEILALIDTSRVLFLSGDKNGAIKIFKSITDRADREIFLNSGLEDYLKALISFQMGDMLFSFGQSEHAIERLDYALLINTDFRLEEDMTRLLELKKTPTYAKISEVDKMLDKVWESYEKGDYKGMAVLSRQILDKTKRISYKRGVFGGEYYLSMALLNMDDYDNATNHAIRAQELAEKGNDKKRLSMVYNLTGNIFKQKKELDKALYYYKKNLDMVKDIANQEGETVALHNIGNVLMDKGSYSDALQYFEQGVRTSIELGNVKHLIAQGYLNIGRALKKVGEYGKAEKNLVLSVNMFRELNNEGGELVCLSEIADNYALEARYDVAIEILENNLERTEGVGLKQSYIDDIVSYAKKNGDYLRIEKYKKTKKD